MYTNELFDFGHSKDGNPSLIDGMIRMKIHEQGTFAKFLNSIDIEKNTEALSLKAGWEYHIVVTPFGVRSTSNRKSLSKEKRGCLLEDEVPEGSMFKKYSQNNCKYECHVTLAKQSCGCVPWDFMDMSSSGSVSECDVFGRTCFYNEMKNLTEGFEDQCPHCLEACDFDQFKVEITAKYNWMKSSYLHDIGFLTNKTFLASESFNFRQAIHDFDYYYYHGNLNEKISADLLEKTIIVHVTLITPKIDLVDVEYPIWDKFANFGGNFGIFAEITGIHFLGVMNGIILAIKLLSTKTLSKIKRNRTKPSKTTSKKV